MTARTDEPRGPLVSAEDARRRMIDRQAGRGVRPGEARRRVLPSVFIVDEQGKRVLSAEAVRQRGIARQRVAG